MPAYSTTLTRAPASFAPGRAPDRSEASSDRALHPAVASRCQPWKG